MHLSSNFLLDENELNSLPDSKKNLYILKWLLNLDQNLVKAKNNDVKDVQKNLVNQLIKQIHNSPGPPTRNLLGKCLANLFNIGDAFLLFDTVNTCNDILKNKDDSPSFLPTKLACITCIGFMYERLGRLMGRSYEETVNYLLKSLKNAESQLRCEIFVTLRKIVVGMSAAASSLHRDIFKAIKHGLTDRVLPVRCNAAKCLLEMFSHAPFLYTTDLENVFSLCFRSLEGSNYEVRFEIAKVLGSLVFVTQTSIKLPSHTKLKLATLDEVLCLLTTGFIKGGLGSFLKIGAGEMIKGGFSISKEVRVGITHAYVVAAQKFGTTWLEKNLSTFVSHVIEMLANPKALPTHMDAIFSRRCVLFTLLKIGKSLNEKAKLQMIKVLLNILNKYRLQNSIENSNESNTKELNNDFHLVQHVLIVILLEVGCIFEDLGTCSNSFLNDKLSKLFETLNSLLVHSVPSVRIATSWCFRCIAVSSPSQLTLLIDKNLEKLEANKNHLESIHGHAFVLSALIGASCQTPLGMPHGKGKLIFCVAEDLLRSATQNSRLSLQRTQSGWQLIGSIITIETSFVKNLLPRLLLIWKNSFPRNLEDLDSEKARGDAFTWQITLENRTGALAAMASFISHNKPLVTDDVIRRILIPIESAIIMLVNLNTTFKNYGPSVKASSAMVRFRLYETLLLLPPKSYESSYTHLLRLLVSEFTLADNVANTTTSLLKNFCHPDDEIILGSWIQNTDFKFIEDQLQPSNSSGSGALEHDVTYLYNSLKEGECIPSPLPLGVTIIDKSCLLFSHIFRYVVNKHKLQILNHFQECIKHAKVARQEAIQINILTVLLGSLKSFSDYKILLDNEEIKKQFYNLLISMLTHNNPLIRCATGQGLGRLCQITSEGKYLSEFFQTAFEKLKIARDMLTRTGYSIALGFLHRFVGSLGSNQNLNNTISLLLALSQDSTSPVVQLWALHSLTLIVDSGGPMFRSYIDVTLQHALKLLNSIPSFNGDVHQCTGRLLSALITTIGPELQDDNENINYTRQSLLISCFIMKNHTDPLVQAVAINCFQQLHMFSPNQLDLAQLVPSLCDVLKSPHLFLRRASVSCLYQLSQREAKEVCEFAENYFLNDEYFHNTYNLEHGLPELLFNFLDEESDQKLIQSVEKIITSLIYSLTNENLNQVILICKKVLTLSDHLSIQTSQERENDNDNDDDETYFHANNEKQNLEKIYPNWKTKVFATQTLSRIIIYCSKSKNYNVHFDLGKARELYKANKNQNAYLVLHLSDLIRMAFMAVTSENDLLRLEGLQLLELIIVKFANVPEPEFQNHVILEQYQAQVGAALRPAFLPGTPSHVIAMACQVCSAWIGSGVARDLNDLKRVHQLLVSSLSKLEKDFNSTIYNESSATLEKLAILKAWAEVYIVAMKKEEEKTKTKQEKLLKRQSLTYNEEEDDDEIEFTSANNEDLLKLVKPELTLLSENWLFALKDAAILTLPPEFCSQLPYDGGSFYTSDTIDLARPQYKKSWPPILHAACLWLNSTGFDMYALQNNEKQIKLNFHLLFGIAMETMCNSKSDQPISYITECLGSLEALLSHKFIQEIIGKDNILSIELCSVLHRLLVTREDLQCQQIVINIAHLIVKARINFLEKEKINKLKDAGSIEENHSVKDEILDEIGEKSKDGEIIPGKSLVYALAELTLCVLVRQIPELSPTLAKTPGLSSVIINQKKAFNECNINHNNAKLVGSSIRLLSILPDLCNPKTSITILPTVLYLITGILKESTVFTMNFTNSIDSNNDINEKEPIVSIVDGFKNLCRSKFLQNHISRDQWILLLQSTVARVLDICKSYDEGVKLNETIALIIIYVFIMESPREVLQPPNFHFPCINLLKNALDCKKTKVQLKCLEVLNKVFTHKNQNVAIPYILSLAPGVIQLVNLEITASLSNNLTKSKYEIIKNGLEIIKQLNEISEKKINILMIYVPLLIKLLVKDVNEYKAKPFSLMLHNDALNKLNQIGITYPQEFKQMIIQVPSYRSKLECAIKNNQGTLNKENSIKKSSNQTNQLNINQIKLKTDFSNYS